MSSRPRVVDPVEGQATGAGPPLDHDHLDALLDELGVSALVVSSAHNLQYVTGVERFFLYALADSVGLGRYVPLVALRRGSPEDALYAGLGNEGEALEVKAPWMEVHCTAWSATDAAATIADRLSGWDLGPRLGVELPYLPADAADTLRAALPGVELVDATQALEELRAIKTERELEIVRAGSADVVDAMVATFAAAAAGWSKRDVVELLRREETARGLTFDYCLIAAGENLNRSPSRQKLRVGDAVSLDSGAHRAGFVADLARMGVVGEPTELQVELLAQVELIQQAVRAAVAPRLRAGDVFVAARDAAQTCPQGDRLSFLAHGCGMVTHEAPRLTAAGSPLYPATHANRPFEAGMVLSVETHIADPVAGFVKLEDTLIVHVGGAEPVGDHGRGFSTIAVG